MNAARLYLRYVGISIRAQMQYRVSFLLTAFSQFIAAAVGFFAMWALFDRFGSLRGWRLEEVAMFYGLVNTEFALSVLIGRGFDTFPWMVKSGDFDRLLLRPRATAFQVIASQVQLSRLGYMAQAMAILIWSAASLGVEWDAARIGLVIFTLFGGTCLFAGLLVMQATLGFWTTETLELMNVLTHGGTETAQYPLSIYRPWFRKIFTFLVPLACVTYFPGLAILGRDDPVAGSPVWFRFAAPSIGVLFLFAMLLFWRFGVKRYRSTGS